MKKFVTFIMLSWTALATAQTADQFIAAGTNDLVANNWWGAHTNFAAAVAASPTNETANALEAALRLLVLPQTPAGSNFLVALGFPRTNLWLPHFPEGGLPEDTNSYPIFPANYNSTNIIYFFRTNVMAALGASLTNLANVTHTNFLLTLAPNETTSGDVTLDFGDIQLLRASLAAMEFWGYTLNENDFSTVLPQVSSMIEDKTFSWQAVLDEYPDLLTMQNTNDLRRSEGALTNAIALYFAASDFIRNARPADATNRLFELDTNDINAEAQFRTELTNVLLSLNGPTEFRTNHYTSTINLAAWFSGTNSLNQFLPEFNGYTYVNNSLPDYTFGGILPYEPAYRTEKLLRDKWPWPSFAGIYIGDGGLSDNNYYSYGGSFAVFVSTNQQATLIGHDDGDGTGNDSFGVVAQFAVDKHGYWEVSSNDFSGSGNIGHGGWFYGELDYSNGTTVWLNGYQQSPLGPFQNPAGLYHGTFNANDGGNIISGTLQVIVAADGEVFYVPISDTYGVGSGGGPSQLDSNNQFSDTQVSGTIVSGTLDTNTFAISGDLSGNISGSFNADRGAKVPFDVPPVITANPVAGTNITLGTTVTFFLTATGSPPLCYQWYLNGDPIAYANGNTLVVSNNLWAAAGTYFISATVDNVVGETNSFTAVSVTSTNVQLMLTSLQPLTGNGFAFSIEAASGVNGHIEVSTNLLDWATLTNFTGGGTINILDPAATNSTDRFYRARVP
jgi:hypothetical protein